MIVLDTRSFTPPFEQIRVQLAKQITDGELHAGDRLPTVRRLADDLGIAPNTVARAYRELEHQHLIETRGRNGTVVAWSADAAERELEQRAADYATRSLALGVDPQHARRIVDQALRAAATASL